MTLAGTRPPTVDEWELYEPHHRARMAFRPGLTGMWQVSGRSNITDFEEVVKLDTKYISEWSLKEKTFLQEQHNQCSTCTVNLKRCDQMLTEYYFADFQPEMLLGLFRAEN